MNNIKSFFRTGEPALAAPGAAPADVPAAIPATGLTDHQAVIDSDPATRTASAQRSVSADSLSSDPKVMRATDEKISSETQDYASGVRLLAIMLGLSFAVLLVAVDQTIVATAIPKITNQFHATEDIGWYASAYFLTAAALTAIWGKVYQNFNVKYWFLVTLGIFELGSLICGVAQDSVTLIVGRAVAGLGVSGIFSGALVIIAYETPLEKRSAYLGMIGGVYGMSSIVGPLLGGAFTERITWRWCFFINLPIGALTAVSVLLFVRIKSNRSDVSFRERVARLDFIGLAVFMPAIICLLLAIQWGGSTYAWNNSRIIGLFIGAGLLAIIFIGIQFWQQDRAMLPPRVLRNRYVWACSIFAFFFTANFFILTYYIPIYFQSVKGSSAIHSAVQLLPFMISVIISSIASGMAVTKLGRFTPILIGGVIPLAIGTGLITTWTVDTGHAKWIGYQVFMGLGTGGSFQIPLTAVQSALSLEDIPTGSACVSFALTLGGALGVGAAQSLFINSVTRNLAKASLTIPVESILSAGATGFRDIVPAAEIPLVVDAYMHGITATFRTALIAACISFLFVVCVPLQGTVKKGDEALEAQAAGAV